MSVRKLVRAVLAPPHFEGLAAPTRAATLAAEKALHALGPLAPATVFHAPDERFASLTHRLSDVIEQLSPGRAGRCRSEQEALACTWLEERLEAGLASTAGFHALLGALNARIDCSGGWRTGQMGIAADAAGNRIQFPPRTAVPTQLEQIRGIMLGSEPAVFRAMAAFALLVNAHPFMDGNGRTARILFNATLRRAGMPATAYIPFSELASRARGGFEIRLRQAEIHGKWEPIIEFTVAMLTVHQALSHREDPRSRLVTVLPARATGCTTE